MPSSSLPSSPGRVSTPARAIDAASSAAGRLASGELRAVRRSVCWVVAVLAVLMIARLLRPESGQTLTLAGLGLALPELCTMRRWFGIDCPGCGLTRSFALAVRFRLVDAWAMHPVGTLLVGYLAASVPLRLWQVQQLLSRRRVRSTELWEWSLVACLVAAAYIRWIASALLAG